MRQEPEYEIEAFRAMIEAGTLRRGLTRAEVKELLGEPAAMGGTSRRYPTPSIFKYGRVELWFGPRAQDGLTAIFQESGREEEPVYLPLPE